MKHFLTSLLFLIGLTGLAQPTYLDLFIQFDQYPAETSWLVTSGNDTIYTSPSYAFSEYVNGTTEQRLFLEAGVEYKFYMFDTFGDGICCAYGPGYFTLENECQGLIVEDLEFGQNSIDYSFTLAPCIPEILTADVTFRVDLANAPPGIETPGVLGSWNGWQIIPMTLGGNGIWFADVEVPLGNHLWKFADFNNPEIQELPAGVNDSPCFLFDEFGYINRTLNVIEEDDIILPPYCWESCLPCGGVAGCTNFSAINWNPWANFDDGSCIVQNNDCPPGETIIEIRVTPDQWGGETSWKLYNDFGEVAAVEPQSCNGCGDGEYSNSPPFIPVSTFLCIPTGIEYDLIVFDTWGDGILGDGGIQIFDCEGTEIWASEPFEYQIDSPIFTPTECDTTNTVEGCTDSNYTEYNPEATIDDGSCLTEKIYGCLDDTQFNYNIEANTEEIIESCEFNLTLTDGVGDGWFGSTLGIWQFGYNSPLYQMGPDDGFEESFSLTLDATQPAYIYFFVTPQSLITAQQCGFKLTNPEGEIIIEVPSFFIVPFLNESGWYAYEITPYCGNTCIPIVEGCLDNTAFNYNEAANTDDSSCYYAPGCTIPAFLEYHTQGFEADFDDGSCLTLAEFGCMDPGAPNYNEFFTVNWTSATDPTDPCEEVIEGCMDENALNFDPLANVNNFDCIYPPDPILGCTIPEACNYNELANTNDDSCEFTTCAGCVDEIACNYDPTSTIDNGACEYPEVNYDCDGECLNDVDGDGICDEEELIGCTDDTAFNFVENATDDDGSCLYDAGCSDTPGEPYWLNDVCFAWVINDVTPGCCGDWSESCQGLYNLCQENGIVTSVEDLGATQIIVFPNPTQDILNIVSNLNLNVTLYNTIGQPVIQQNNPSQIDISNLGAGIYHMILDYNGLQFTKKIIKQ